MKKDRRALKFFIGYFSLIPFAISFSTKLFFIVISLFVNNPKLPHTFFSVKDFIFLAIVLLIYFFVYKRWQSLRLLTHIFFSVFFTDLIFGIVIVFTWPFWILLPVILIAYGFFTGLFKKDGESSIPDSNNMVEDHSKEKGVVNQNIAPIVKKKTKIVRTLFLFSSIVILLYFINFGGLYPCRQSYTKVSEPDLKIGDKVVLSEDAYLLKGDDIGVGCRWAGPDFSNYIDKKEGLESCVNCRDVFAKKGTSISDLAKGKQFIFSGAYDVENNGLAKWGGTGKNRWWSLKDENGVSYMIRIMDEINPNLRIIFPLKGFEQTQKTISSEVSF